MFVSPMEEESAAKPTRATRNTPKTPGQDAMKRLFKTPKRGAKQAEITTPVTEAIKEMLATPAEAKKAATPKGAKAGKVTKAKTPAGVKTPHLKGVRELLKTPKEGMNFLNFD